MNNTTPAGTGLAVSIVSPESKDEAVALNISFNGTQFVYRDYKYDKLADAVSYARQDALRVSSAPFGAHAVTWVEPATPSADDRALMAQYGVSTDQGRFRYRDYLYDRMADAIAYASHHPGA
jgi:hypothetical protein